MDRSPSPSLLPIFRSQQQAEILHLLLSQPEAEFAMTDLAEIADVPYASTHREVERAERAGLVTSRKVGRTRVVRANAASPYFTSLADLLVRAFGPPSVFATELASVGGVDRALIFGSWASAAHGEVPARPVEDLDLLVLGDPDRGALYAAVNAAEKRLGREVQVVVRAKEWLADGSGAFHANVVGRPVVEVDLR